MDRKDKKISTILVVDDSPVTIQSISAVLIRFGYLVLSAERGSAALELLKAETPDLIILDIDMPELDGYKICARIKQNQKTRDIPVLFLSGFEETFDIVKGFNAGAIDYITKPVATDELMVRVQTHLSQLSRHRELLETNVALVTENREYIVNEARLKARVAELEQELRLKSTKLAK